MEKYTLPPHLANNSKFKDKNWVIVTNNSGRVKVAPDYIAVFLQLLGELGNNGHYHSLYVHKTAHSLKSTFGNSFRSTISHTNLVLPFKGGRIQYQVHSGVVYLMDIEILPREDREGTQAGFYHARYVGQDQIEIDKTESINTKFAAVSGISTDAKNAAAVMRELIPEGYDNTGTLKTEGFTYYYDPNNSVLQALRGLPGKWRSITGFAEKSADAMHIASAMAEAHAAGREIKWTMLENGTALYVGALRVLNDKGINLDGKQSAFYINPTSNLMMADFYGRQVGIVKADKGSHIIKPLSVRQALLGGNILGSVWMRVSQTNGNWADKTGAATDELMNSAKSFAVYGSISLSAVAAASGNATAVGSLIAPSLSMGGALGYALLALGYMGWGMSLLGVFANVGYRRYDQNTKQNPFASILGKQLT